MSEVMDDLFFLGLKALIQDPHGKILLIHKPLPSDYWDLPGGRIQPGETIDQALLREVTEEIGEVIVSSKNFFSADIANIQVKDQSYERGLILFTYLCSIKMQGEIIISNEHDLFQWFSIDEAAEKLSKKFGAAYTQKIKDLNKSKLVRDNIPEIITAKGQKPKIHIADQEEYQRRLTDKLSEEVNEYIAEDSNKKEELADILEVVQALIQNAGYDPLEVEEIRQKKAKKNGAFLKRIILDATYE